MRRAVWPLCWLVTILRRVAPAVFPLLALIGILALGTKLALALDVPPLSGRVVDRANILPREAEARISARLEAHERATGNQFAVLTIPSLEGEALEDFSIRVVESWKLGKQGKDTGLLLLVVSGERKVRIEVGYGLEGDITDAQSSRIIREIIAPAFLHSDFAGGIDAALTALMKAASGEAPDVPGPVEPAPDRPSRRVPLSTWLWLLLMILPFILPPFLGGRRRRGLGGFFIGGMGGGFPRGGGGFGGGGFSGGGGGFGGGGASGRW